MGAADKRRVLFHKTLFTLIGMGHLGESFVLKRRKSPNIPTLAFVDKSVWKEFSNSNGKRVLCILFSS